jgi:photoactive yellow protein
VSEAHRPDEPKEWRHRPGVGDREELLHRLAPCTNNKVFRGCFRKGVEQGTADCLFSYTFTYKMKPTPVKVHLHRANGANWMLIAKS